MHLSLLTFMIFISGLAIIILFVVCFVRFQERNHSVEPPSGYSRLGLAGRSNLSDEQHAEYASGREPDPDGEHFPTWKVKALEIFPIKSCAAVELDEADTCPIGLVWDREFSFAELLIPETHPDAPAEEKQPSWRFRTQRTPGYEKLALIKPELWFPIANSDPSQQHGSGGLMIVRYPHVYSGRLKTFFGYLQDLNLIPKERSFAVPLDPPKKGDFESKSVIIWKDKPNWFDYGKYLPSDLTNLVGVQNPLSLFRADPARYREVMRCAPRKDQLGYQSVVGFQDAYPLHLLNLASVRDVGEKVKKDLPVFSARRFRANIITVGPKAYDEDDWKRVRIGPQEYHCACHTVRCKLPNVDPVTAIRHKFEPDRTLRSFRRIDAGDSANPCLGMQLVPAQQTGKIRVGDQLEVLERGEHLYIKQ